MHLDLALDAGGEPWVAFSNSDSGGLWVARRSGGVWSAESVDASVGECRVAIATDGNGSPSVAYVDAGSDVRFARLDGITWSVETVDSGADGYPSVALDGTGRPHITYQADGRLLYASRDLATSIHAYVPPAEGLVIFPNPFRERAYVALAAGLDDGPVTVDVHDVSGRCIRKLAAGGGATSWDGQDDSGRSVSPGVYFIRVQSKVETRSSRVTRIR
jgi:hypothetical protein